ncbi:VaFE repeat-containing surface-anchored protein [Corynebacterium uberis]|uniref:VaFE repeat-containing surface-anchored protein n=3 Tax=Corynebacterium TaxID=1716 RepID=UPI001D09AA8A|nr:VaFE repeat-containing surface-anchored protein [Corynebacterium uberis]UDL80518.1 VaFE repeat-containing surface-anchored protein [Corynebacterium uberis]
MHPPTAKADETNGYGEAVTGWTAITPEGAPAKPNAQGQLEGELVATRDGKQGYGWCIDFGIHNPTKAPKNIKYTGPVRLTHVKPLYTREIAQVFNYGDKQETARGVDLNQDKDRRNVMIHLVKELKKAQKRGDTERASKLARSLQLVSASFYETNKQVLQYTYNGVRQYGWNLNNAEFEQLTGYKVAKGEDSQYFLEHTGKANPPIPEAAPDEYLTIISPTEYRLDKVRPSEAQRLITIDQPGLKIGPEIGTKAAFKGENHQVKAGAVITDTVSYKNLAVGKEYTLNAKLVDKKDASRVLGEATKTFKTPATNTDGEVMVDIPVKDDVTTAVESAVVFETLTSTAVDKDGAPTTDGAVREIAKHEDINDDAQTVTTEKKVNAFKPAIGTVASWENGKFGNDRVPSVEGKTGKTTVFDRVKIDNIAPDKTYKLTGVLHKKNAEGGDGGAIDGATASREFTSAELEDAVTNEKDGSVSGYLVLEIPGGDKVNAGESAVVFETLTSKVVDKEGNDVEGDKDQEIAKHENIGDAAQTVTVTKKNNAFVPNIGTEASWEQGKFGNDRVASMEGETGSATVYDRVKIDNIAKDKTYKLTGVLHKKNADGTDGGAIEGATASREFTHTDLVDSRENKTEGSYSGYLVLEIPGGDKVNAGESAVVFEKLTSTVVDKAGNDIEGGQEQEIAKHENIGDASQTVTVTKPRNAFEPRIGTEASWENGRFGDGRVANVEGATGKDVVYDNVYVENIAPDKEYKLIGELHKKNADGTDGGVIGTSEPKTFTSADLDGEQNKDGSYSGYIVIEVPGGSKINAGESGVVFETLTSAVVDKEGNDVEGGKDQEIAKHHDITDEDQTVSVTKAPNAFVPKIGTEASWENGKFGDERVSNVEGETGKASVFDRVKIENIAKDKTYKLTGVLHKKNADGGDGGAIEGATASREFTSAELEDSVTNEKDGSVSGYLVLEIPGADKVKAGESAVAFEKLTSTVVDKAGNDVEGGEEQEIAKHENIEDAAQTVTVTKKPNAFEPKIKTEAFFDEGLTQKTAEGEAPSDFVYDKVSVSNIVPGKEYALAGELMSKAEDGKKLGEGSVTFTDAELKDRVENADGSVSGSIVLKVSGAKSVKAGESAVVFETLTSKVVDKQGNETPGNEEPKTVAEHKDPNDEDQIVSVGKKPNAFEPKIKTEAFFDEGLTQKTAEGEAPSDFVYDKVSVSNIVPGKEYALAGELMSKAEDGKKLGEGSVTFTDAELKDRVENADGSVSGSIVLKVSGAKSVKAGESAVVFETLTSKVVDKQGNETPGNEEPKTVAEHKDPNDEDQIVSVGKKPNAFEPKIKTEAFFDEGLTQKTAEGEAPSDFVYDKVSVSNIVPGKEYALAGELMSKAEDGKKLGEGSVTFTDAELKDRVENADGSVSGSIVLKVSGAKSVKAGESAVVFETLTSKVVDKQGNETPGNEEPKTVAEHKDPNDEDQIVSVGKKPNAFEPKIKTEAFFDEGLTQKTAEGEAPSDFVYDKVSVSNIVPGKEYALAGELMSKAEDGKKLGEGSVTFTDAELKDRVENADGSVSGSIVLKVSGAKSVKAGESAVVFETLTSKVVDKQGNETPGNEEPKTVAEHKDPNDEDQIVSVGKKPNAFEPKIKTEAFFDEGLTQKTAEGEAPSDFVYDKVSVSNIVPGKEYALAGELMSKAEDGKKLGEGSVTFTDAELKDRVENADGSVSGSIVLKVSGAKSVKAGESAVVFETLTSKVVDKQGNETPGNEEPKTVAEHKDPNDEDQIVSVGKKPNAFEPKIKTEAFFDEGLTQKTAEGEAPSDFVYDKVSVSNIVPGKEYALAGELMSKAEDGKKLGEGSVTFTDAELKDRVENADGSVSGSIVLKVSGAKSVKAGESAVVFETLTSKVVDKQGNETPGNEEPKTVAEHKDPNDEDQIVSVGKKPNAFEPKIKTEAFFDEGLTQKTAEGEAPSDFVYDKVSVSNIVPGKEYALAGELMSKAEDGKKLGEGSVTFTDAELKDRVENADGSVSGSIVLKVSGAKSVKAGESAVVFETLTSKVVDKQGNETPGNEEPKTVAEHKDPNDEDQIVSVTKPEPTESTTPEATTEETPTESTTPEDGGVVPPPSVTEEETTPEISDEPTESTTPESPVESTTPDECATESTTPGKPGEPGEGESTTPGKPGEGESTTPGKPGEPGEGTTTEECEPSESTTPDKPKAEPKIGTRAEFAKDSKTEVVAGATIIDNVEYTGLVGGKEYTLNAQLVDKTDASKVLGTGSVTFTPGSADGDVDVTITVDESVTEPVEAAVAFETLTSKVVDKDGNDVEGDKDQEIAKHHDIDDPNQTVISKRPTESTTPEATTEESPTESTTPEETSPESPVESTTPEETSPESPVESTTPESPAASTTPEEGGVVPPPSVTEEETTPGVSGESTTPESPVESTTPDECATESTTPGKPGEPGEGESTTPGKPGEGESTTPGKPGEPGEGTTTEECEPSESTTPDKPKAEPKIGTRADFAKDSKTEVVAGATIIDNVEYTGLVGGKEYTLNAQLVDKTDASKVLGTGSVTFTPGSADGDVDVTITVDESVTEPVEAAVAFETLTSKVVDKQGNETPGNTEDTVIAEHKDINDDNQTVISKRPTESTTPESPAASTTPGTEEPGPAPSKTEEETTPGVSGESTTPESPVESTTPDECATESTTPGKPGEPGEGESTTPGKPGEPGEGTTTEECEPSESTTPGVSDESTTPDEPGKPGGGESTTPGKPGVPGKPGSEEPSKKTPKISTSAHIEGDGVLAKGAKVVDTVTFTNLVPGKKYVLNGELMCKAGGKSTGATGTVTFVPFKEDGSVNLTIEVTDGDCAEQVVFETLRDRDGNVVAIHHDINDAAQTVTAKDALKPGPKETPKDKNVNVVVNKKPDNGKPSEPKAERRPIKSVPSGSLQWVPGMEVAI